MKKEKEKHVHRLKRHKYKTGYSVYFCTLPDCYFKISTSQMVGKKSICNLCSEEFIMSDYSCKLLRPHCEKCGKIKVLGEDGQKLFIRRGSLPQPVRAALVSNSSEGINDLRSRLNGITNDIIDEDI